MGLSVDAKAILSQLERRIDRAKTSLYLSKSIYSDFKRATKATAPSVVMEELMKLFIESTRKREKQKVKKVPNTMNADGR